MRITADTNVLVRAAVCEGRRLGGANFASFDRKAVELIAATGADTRLLSAD